MHDLINQLNFDPEDPFELKVNIFPEITKSDPNFLSKFFYDYLLWTWSGEYNTTLVYPNILDKIKKDQYKHYLSDLSATDLAQVKNYFEQMIQDEIEHTDDFASLILNCYDPNFNSNLDKHRQEVNFRFNNGDQSGDLLVLLFKYYVGECYLWTTFYTIYKQTTNPAKRAVIKKFLVDEARHNNNIFKFFKKIKHHLPHGFDNNHLSKRYSEVRYFGLPFVKKHFDIEDLGTRKDQAVLKMLYNTPWHQKFNQIFIKKCYQLHSVIDPTITQEDFTRLVNHNNGF